MPSEWHQFVPILGHVEESETAKNVRDFHLPGSFFVCYLYYNAITLLDYNLYDTTTGTTTFLIYLY